jgi:hypothetical protein
VRFHVLAAAIMKTAVFWVVAPCNLVEVIALIMETASTPETSANFYQTKRRNNPEDSLLRFFSASFRNYFFLCKATISSAILFYVPHGYRN